MTPARTDQPYRDLVKASEQYLGPAAERFVRRQIYQHLDKEPESISRNDISKLIEWIQPAFALITNDATLVDNYVHSLQEISKTRTAKKGRHGNNN